MKENDNNNPSSHSSFDKSTGKNTRDSRNSSKESYSDDSTKKRVANKKPSFRECDGKDRQNPSAHSSFDKSDKNTRDRRNSPRKSHEDSTKGRVANESASSEERERNERKNTSARSSFDKSSGKNTRDRRNSPRKSRYEDSTKRRVANERASSGECERNERKNTSARSSFDKSSETYARDRHCKRSTEQDNVEKNKTTRSISVNESSNLKFSKDGAVKTYSRPSPKKQPDITVHYENTRDLVEADIGRSNEKGSELANAIAFLLGPESAPPSDSPRHAVTESEINTLEEPIRNIGEQEAAEKPATPSKEMSKELKMKFLLSKINTMGIDNFLDMMKDKL